MKRRTLLQDHLTPTSVFLYGLVILVTVTLVMAPFTGGESFFSLVHSIETDTFMDLFNSIYDAGFENPYAERGVIYPPLTYLYYRLCGMLLPPIERVNDTWFARNEALKWRASQFGILLALLTTVLSYILLYKALLPREKRQDSAARRLVMWTLLGTVPFWYVIERGNLILLTVGLLAYFVSHYRSENKLRRELALICLALAVSFKIYPVVFGLLLLMDKQYLAALRCALYGAALFFLPFLFFGGFESVFVMLQNISKTSTLMADYGWGYKVNIDNTLHFLAECFHVPLVGVNTVKIGVFLIMIGVFVLTKKHWQRLMILSSLMILFPGFSYTYTLIFIVIPLVAFFLEEPKESLLNLLFALLFLCLFAPFPFGGYKLIKAEPENFYQLNLTTVISSLAILAVQALMAVDVVCCRIERKKARTEQKALCLFGVEIPKYTIWFAVIVLVVSAALEGMSRYWNYLYYLDIVPK